jgi:hypothetical protein
VSEGILRVVPNLMAYLQALDLSNSWMKEGIGCFEVEKFKSLRIYSKVIVFPKTFGKV